MNTMNQPPSSNFQPQPPTSSYQPQIPHQPLQHSNSMYPDSGRGVSQSLAAIKHKKQHWINQQHQNQKIGNELYLKGYNIKNEPRSFLFTVKKLTSIPFRDVSGDQPPERDARYSLEYYLTLFNEEIGPKGNFYGRTFRSKPIQLKEVQGYWESDGEDFVYFHTNFHEKSTKAVVECVIIKEHKNRKTYGCVGFARCNIFEFKQGLQDVSLTRGSPRSIGQIEFFVEPGRGLAVTKLTYDFRDFPSFDLLKQLIPQNCFCGSHDIVPGLVGNHLPNPITPQGTYNLVRLDHLPKQTIYIHNIQLITSQGLESKFENFHIRERRIIVSVHNTWKSITDDVYVSLLAPDHNGVISSGGSLTIKNFVDHPMIALIIRVEYKATKPGERGTDAVNFTIGWQCHLPQFSRSGQVLEENIQDEFILGPGKVPTGDLLWTPKLSDMTYYKVQFKAQISGNPNAPKETFENRLAGGLGGQAPPFHHSQTMRPGDQHYGQPQYGAGQQYGNQPPYGQQVGGQPSQYGAQSSQYGNQGYQQQQQQQIGIDPRIQAEQDIKMRQMQAQLEVAQRQAQEMMKKQEEMEMQRLRNQQQNQYGIGQGNQMNQSYNNQQYRTDPRLEEQMRLQELQKQQLQQQVETMQREMRQYMDSIKDAQSYNQQQQNSQYYNEINRQLQQPLPRDSAQQIAMIANVFYNMLNLIGESEKDQKILGLSENLKKMIQTQRFDDLLAPKAPYVGMGAINLLKTIDLPIKDQVNFIKMGYGDLLHHPTAQITSSSISKDHLSMDIEKHDPLKASAINVKFICFKTPWTGLEKMPSKFYFELKFFTFPTVITDKVKIKPVHLGEPLRSGESYYLTKELSSYGGTSLAHTASSQKDTLSDPNLISLSFEIDPSISKIKEENMKLAKYLRERFLTVDVFDGDSLFLYGTCKIPLFEILRQGRSFVVRAKECEMCDPNTGDFKGALQVIIGNQGRAPSITEDQHHKIQELSINSPLKIGRGGQPAQGHEEKKKFKKHVKSRPMDLTKSQQTNNPYATGTSLHQTNDFRKSIISQSNQQDVQYASVANADLRKKLRVDRVRKMVMGEASSHMSVEDPMQPDWAKFKSLKEIELIRETKKEQVINNVISEYITDQFQLAVISGQLEFLTVKLYNPYNQNEVFTIKIQDEDEHLLQHRELQVVTDQMEYRHWVTQGKCARPPSWDCITQTGDIILKPNDEIEVLFKYFTLREADLSPKTPPTSETVKKRNIRIIFFQSKGTAHQTIDVTVVPSSSPIDHTFRYYEPENSHVTIQIPPFVQLNYPGLTALVSRPNSFVDIEKSTSIIRIEAKTERSPSITEMTLYLYGDQYKEDLLATVKIEIYALITIYTKIKAGMQSSQTLALPSETARTVKIFASEPRCVFRSPKEDQQIKLVPQSVSYISVQARIFGQYQQKVRVNCIDVMTGELVYGWLMMIDSEKPKVTGEESFVSKCNQMSVQKLQFTNKLNLRTVYEFASSRPDMVKPKEESVMFEPKEFKPIALEFLPQSQYGTTDVYLYASDQDQNICECILLKLAYLP